MLRIHSPSGNPLAGRRGDRAIEDVRRSEQRVSPRESIFRRRGEKTNDPRPCARSRPLFSGRHYMV